MAREFYVVHDAGYMTGRAYTYEHLTFDEDDIELEDVMNKLSDEYGDDYSCDTDKWDDYNTFYEIYEVVNDIDKYIESCDDDIDAIAITDDDEMPAEVKIINIVDDYTENGCEDDPNAINRIEELD